MSRDFDPYYKWLGIRPEEQPPHHYRLLAIALFESDGDVISSAADQRMAHVRMFQSGKYSELSQRILNEIAVARVCLLNRQKKAQYDAELRAAMAAAEPVAEAQEAPAEEGFAPGGLELPFSTSRQDAEPAFLSGIPEPASAAPVQESPLDFMGAAGGGPTARRPAASTYRRPTRKKSSSMAPVAIGGGVIALLALGGIVWLASAPPKDGDGQKAAASRNAEEEKTAKTGRDKTDLKTRPGQGLETEKPKVDDGGKTSLDGSEGKTEESKLIEKKTEAEKPAKPDPEEEEAAELAKTFPAGVEGEQLVRDRLARAKSPDEFVMVAKAGRSVMTRVAMAGDRDLAIRVGAWALSAARKSDDSELVRDVTLRILRLQGKARDAAGTPVKTPAEIPAKAAVEEEKTEESDPPPLIAPGSGIAPGNGAE